MAASSAGTKIVLQVGEELRIRSNGDLIVDNPELELAREERAADAVLLYRFDAQAGSSRPPRLLRRENSSPFWRI